MATPTSTNPVIPPTTPPPVTPKPLSPVTYAGTGQPTIPTGSIVKSTLGSSPYNSNENNAFNASFNPTESQSQANSNITGYDSTGKTIYGSTISSSVAPAVGVAPFGSAPNGTPYGGQNSNNANPNSSVYGINGNPATTSIGTGNASGTQTTGNPDVDALAKAQNDLAVKSQQLSDSIAGITNGTIPLSAGDQAQVQGLQQQFQQLIDQQTTANSGANGVAQTRGYQTGAAEYDPSFQVKTIGAVVSAGQAKITNLQIQEASSVAQLTQALKDNNIKGIQASYDAYTKANAATQAALKTTIADTQGAINDAHIANVLSSGVTDPKDILKTLQSQGYTDISSADITKAINNLSPDAKDILSIANTAITKGASPEEIASIMASPDTATATKILAQSGVANSAVNDLMTKYPDAGIVPGDSIDEANKKIQSSSTYSMAQKNAAADLAYKQAQTAQLISQVQGNSSVGSKNTVEMTGDNTPNQSQQAQFLSALPTDLATLVKGIANYQINPSSVPTRNYKGVGGLTQSQVLTLVSQYDPSFSQQNYNSRQSLMTNFASGKYSQNINSLNTAVGHISDILGNFSGLDNAGFTPYNAAKNAVENLFGSGNIGRAALNINAATSEIASTFKGAGATDEEIKALGILDANSSPDQVNAYIETATQLLASRLGALQDTYTSGMGKAPTNSFLSPTSQQALLKLQQQGLDIKVPQLADSPLVKIQTFHDASTDNAKLLDGIMANHPELQNDPQKAIDFLNQQGINL